jgi:large subunit ribosomal protein L23
MALFGKTKKEKKEKVVAKTRARSSKSIDGSAHAVILAPWFSEKALMATEKGVYAFAVAPRATKAEIAGAIKEIYNVEPRQIRVINVKGKAKQMRARRGTGTRADRRKAYVFLNAGDTIQFA